MKVAIYCRLSEEDRNKQQTTDDSESIRNQKVLLIQYAVEKKWDIYNIYSDDDYTGSDRNRPAFRQLLEDAEKHKFDIILCKTQSRFTRELELVEKYIHGLFPLWHIRFVSIVDNADTDIIANKKSRQINGLINEWYLEDMSENIKSVLTNKRMNGLHIGSFALYGYKKDPDEKGHLLIDEEAASIVREVFTLYSAGIGKTAIARILNDRGIPNPTEYKRLHGLRYQQPKSKRSTLWSYYAISDMLCNEIYIGNMVQGRYGSVSYKSKKNRPRSKEQWIKVEHTHEAIIDRELWDRVQALIKIKAKPTICGKVGLFAKKVRCSYCGYTMRSTKSHGIAYLRCSTRYSAQTACSGSFISVEKLEEAVRKELSGLLKEYLDYAELERMIKTDEPIKERKEKIEKEISIYKRKVEEYNKGLKQLYLDKIRGIITEREFLEYAKDFRMEQDHLNLLINNMADKLNTLCVIPDSEDKPHQIIEEYMNPIYLNREIIDKMIEVIYVGGKDPLTHQIQVDIHWNF